MSTVRVFAKIDEDPSIGRHGQVFTKPHIVDLILDLCGYTSDRDLSQLRLLDPGCGDGAFVCEAARRLLDSMPPSNVDLESISDCLCAVEKDAALAMRTTERLAGLLREFGAPARTASRIAKGWVSNEDFLIADLPAPFDVVVGNPPYVRQEAIPRHDLELYRERFACFFDRADLYMAFIEKGLGLLSDQGVLGYICPNRFARNRYGQKLRSLIVSDYKLTHMIDLANTSPFDPEVLAYPGIFVIGRGKTGRVKFAQMESASAIECNDVRAAFRSSARQPVATAAVHEYEEWFDGEEPWITESPEHLALIRRLETEFPTLGSTASGTKVGIGVATGADGIFIVDRGFEEVEPELLVPLATTADILSGSVEWQGRCVINPFKSEATSELISLSDYPLARRYFELHRKRIEGRNVSKRNPDRWFRTIDRIYPSLSTTPKLLIPDIKASNHIVFEPGRLYPHHNLYYVVSDYWDLRALRTVLRSSLAKFFVWVYGVKMRSGWLRFQAQYLRRIRIPAPISVSTHVMRSLAALEHCDSIEEIDAAVAKVYSLTSSEIDLIEQTAGSPAPAK